MKKVLLVLLIILLLTGCGKKDSNKDNQENEQTKQQKEVIKFLSSNILDDNPNYKNNRFYIFTEDGKFARYWGSRIVLSQFDNVFINVGTYEYSNGSLILNHKYLYNQKYNESSDSFSIERKENVQTYTYGEFKIVTRDKATGKEQYVSGKGIRLEKKDKENIPEELVKQVREYLENDFKDFDFNKLKDLEEYDKLNGV